MIKIIKNAFKISFDNIILATPLLIFLLLLNIYLIIAKNAVKALPSAFLFYLTLFLMFSAFLAGWFYMVKVAVSNFKEGVKTDNSNEPFKLMKEFPVGIADYIRPYMGFSILYLIFANIMIVSVYHLGMHFIGNVGITMQQFVAATEAPVAMQALIDSMTKIQLLKINYWYLLIMLSVQIFSLITMFWPIEIMYSTPNPLIAFFKSVLRIFARPQSILLFIYINIINFILVLFNYISMFNPITYLIMTLIFFSFIVYIFVLLFLYYDEKIKGNSDSITDCDGQE